MAGFLIFLAVAAQRFSYTDIYQRTLCDGEAVMGIIIIVVGILVNIYLAVIAAVVLPTILPALGSLGN
jgi:hypothetical protein